MLFFNFKIRIFTKPWNLDRINGIIPSIGMVRGWYYG